MTFRGQDTFLPLPSAKPASALAWRQGDRLKEFRHLIAHIQDEGFPGGASGKEPACQCRRRKKNGSFPGWGRSPGGGHGNPLQYSCLEDPMGRGAWWATFHGVTKSQTQLRKKHLHVLCSYTNYASQTSNWGLDMCAKKSPSSPLFYTQGKRGTH